MRLRKLLAIGTAAVLGASMLAACGGSDSAASSSSAEAAAEETAAEEAAEETAEAPAEETEAEPEEEETAAASESAAAGDKPTVGICQLVQHDALDAATQGFIDALTEAYGEDGIVIDLQNAQGDSSTCSTITTGFASNNYDLIMANATPALQAAVSATDSIPILGTSITDYGTALAMDNFSGTTGMNVSGTSDLAPLDQQADMIKELCPDAEKVAILYCSAEPNSEYQAGVVEQCLDDLGIAYTEYTFADSNDMQSVVSTAASECDAFYIPTDNTAASNMTIVSNITMPLGIPVICGEENMTAQGGLATLSISYYDLGYRTGEQAVEILKDGADVSAMEVAYAKATTKKYNQEYADAIGIEIPSDYEAIEISEE